MYRHHNRYYPGPVVLASAFFCHPLHVKGRRSLLTRDVSRSTRLQPFHTGWPPLFGLICFAVGTKRGRLTGLFCEHCPCSMNLKTKQCDDSCELKSNPNVKVIIRDSKIVSLLSAWKCARSILYVKAWYRRYQVWSTLPLNRPCSQWQTISVCNSDSKAPTFRRSLI